ncbi:sialidase family protein [Marinilabilia salmonicolor]|uniref:sialidase family protein n=1 Tax=Marinilabilia salmonicolor TaxID=989 RepID=UPI00029AD5C8|nr:sialidase family protein [Marinilabilia salmonicolor]
MKPSRFYGTITMPPIGRLKDGRLLFLRNNTTPLPEKEGADGVWEDVFTNRDVLHVAISDDDGRTWKGFRELYLNPNRNDTAYAESNQDLSLDMSVHQTQFVELKDGNILVSLGQHVLHRKLLVFYPDWLLETSREEDFSNGLTNWSTFLYQNGVVGHCAYNRSEGSELIINPADTTRQILRIRKPMNENLETPHQGAVWNFPAQQKGHLETRVFVPSDSGGGPLSLMDRWFNAGDTAAFKYAMFHLDLKTLAPDRWHDLRFEWDLSGRSDYCSVVNAGGETIARLLLNRASLNGISYVHFISDSQEPDDKGFYIEEISARADQCFPGKRLCRHICRFLWLPAQF